MMLKYPKVITDLCFVDIPTVPLELGSRVGLTLFADELGQLSSEFVAAINIILTRIRHTSQMFGGILMIGSLDHTQIQPWEVSAEIFYLYRLFLVQLSN